MNANLKVLGATTKEDLVLEGLFANIPQRVMPKYRWNYWGWELKVAIINREFWRNRLRELYKAFLQSDEQRVDYLMSRLVREVSVDLQFLHSVLFGSCCFPSNDAALSVIEKLIPSGIELISLENVLGGFWVAVREIKDTKATKNRLFALCYGSSLERALECN